MLLFTTLSASFICKFVRALSRICHYVKTCVKITGSRTNNAKKASVKIVGFKNRCQNSRRQNDRRQNDRRQNDRRQNH